MIGYNDKTYCTDSKCAKWKDCPRALTEDVKKDAEKWWGNPNYPITMFAGRIDCYEEPQE
jgi:hypothetical protein